jgi:hypothetical protein
MSDAQAGTAPLLAMPKKKYVVVDFPARVKNVERAVEMLGGLDGIDKVVKKLQPHLDLKFCDEGHSLFSDTTKTQNILVKIKKSSTGVITYETMGIVEDTIQFQGILDYQAKGKTSRIENDLLIEPVLFTRIDKVTTYHFKDNPQSNTVTVTKDGQTETKRSTNGGYKPGQLIAVTITSDFVPPDPPEIGEITDAFEKIVQTLFELRPIWSLRGLKAQCKSSEESRKLKKILPKFAYYVTTGPWRTLWIAYETNPIDNSDYGKYQVLDIRIPTTFKDKIVKRKPLNTNPSNPLRKEFKKDSLLEAIQDPIVEEEEENLDFVFDAIPTQMQSLYQICDVASIDITENQSDVENEFKESTGWYARSTLESMRKDIKKAIENWLEIGVQSSDLRKIKKSYREDAESNDAPTDTILPD